MPDDPPARRPGKWQEPPEGTTLASVALNAVQAKNGVTDLKRILWRAGITGDVDFPRQFRELAEAVMALTETGGRRLPAPNWAGIDDDTREQQMADLTDWVDHVLVPFFPTAIEPLKPSAIAETLKPCWKKHPDVVWELSTVATLWRDAYERKQPDLYRAADWLDRYLPNTVDRVAKALKDCQKTCALTRRRSAA